MFTFDLRPVYHTRGPLRIFKIGRIIMSLNKLFFKDKRTNQIINDINNKKPIRISGLNESRLSFFIGNIINKIDNNVIMITYDSYRIDQLYENLLRLVPKD